MKLPIQITNRDGHMWLQCTHPACRLADPSHGYLSRLDAGQHEANGVKLDEAIQHAASIHGVP